MEARTSPAPLIELATAYWGSATLIAAIRLRLFSEIAAGSHSVNAISDALGAKLEATEALLCACASLQLLTRDGDSFDNTEIASTYLVEGKPGYLGPALLYNGDVFPLWNELNQVILRGDADQAPDQYLGDDASRTKNFVFGMHHRAMGIGQAVAQVIDLSGRRRLADLGGGPGTYSALLTGKHAGLTADVLDLPKVVEIASQIMVSMDAEERVNCLPFDYYVDELPGRYDAVLISGVLHREQPSGVRSIFKKAVAALEPGGVLYISDVMLNDDRDGPVFSTMFALNMRVLAHDGRCHSVSEQAQWLEELGLTVTETHQLPAPINYTVIRAEKRQ